MESRSSEISSLQISPWFGVTKMKVNNFHKDQSHKRSVSNYEGTWKEQKVWNPPLEPADDQTLKSSDSSKLPRFGSWGKRKKNVVIIKSKVARNIRAQSRNSPKDTSLNESDDELNDHLNFGNLIINLNTKPDKQQNAKEKEYLNNMKYIKSPLLKVSCFIID